MSLRWIVIVILVAIAAYAGYAWKSSKTPPPSASTQAEPGMPPAGGTEEVAPPVARDPGITWDVPAGWTEGATTSMRLATYAVPAAKGSEAAECAVFYFGPGQGGGTEANIERWIGEFENASTPERSTRTVGGLKVSRVRLKGNYQSHMGPGAAAGAQAHHELVGAIVEGPAGSVFFKLSGPTPTVDAAVKAFDKMIGSLKKK